MNERKLELLLIPIHLIYKYYKNTFITLWIQKQQALEYTFYVKMNFFGNAIKIYCWLMHYFKWRLTNKIEGFLIFTKALSFWCVYIETMTLLPLQALASGNRYISSFSMTHNCIDHSVADTHLNHCVEHCVARIYISIHGLHCSV